MQTYILTTKYLGKDSSKCITNQWYMYKYEYTFFMLHTWPNIFEEINIYPQKGF